MRVWSILAVVACSAACSGGGSTFPGPTSPTAPTATTPTTPTTPTPAPTTPTATSETFTGTVEVANVDIHPFTVALNNTQLTVTLNEAGPPDTIAMGVGLGTLSGTVCNPIPGAQGTTPASTTPVLSGTAQAGAFCVAVYDAGNMTATVTYKVTVTHF